MMENEFFHNEKYKETLDKFVIVPVDIDQNKSIASYYGVKSIPDVKLVDFQGNIIHDVLGYDGSERTNEEFKGYPDNASILYSSLEFKEPKKPTDEELLILASAYQAMIQMSKTRDAKRNFSSLSNSSLSKCIKETQNKDFAEKAELSKLFNEVLVENQKRAIKKLDVNEFSEINKPFALYIKARAHFENNDLEEGNKAIAQLEQTGENDWVKHGEKLKAKYAK